MNISSSRSSTEIYHSDSYASTLYDRIQTNFETIRADLKEDEELFAYCTTTVGEVIKITGFGFQNPYLMIIYGEDQEMNPCQILTHAYSFQITMKVLKIRDETQNQRRVIGFLGDIGKKSDPESDQ